jgi:tRNA (Thr-GGU) A37 N-methylase
MLDGTPLLDNKRYIPEFDVYPADKAGWLAEYFTRIKSARSDNRCK